MLLVLLAAAGLLYWLLSRGELLPAVAKARPKLARWSMAGASALLALNGLRSGNWLEIAVGVVAAMLFFYAPVRQVVLVLNQPEACAVLGVGPAASALEINAAWRRLIAQVHPDKGGSADLAQRVTAARDLLLARLEPR
jgi:DnaJ-domain-containing protein 1